MGVYLYSLDMYYNFFFLVIYDFYWNKNLIVI